MVENIAILIPCYNEELTISKVITDFKTILPDSHIYVYDNNSTDQTIKIATDLDVIVRQEKKQGKGNVIRRMFADINADYYILVDGDDTYDASSIPIMLQKMRANQLDMVTGVRHHTNPNAYRKGHVLGNKLLTGLVTSIFDNNMSDMLSGYRVFSKRFVKTFPVLSKGFKIETEFSVHALELNMPIDEVIINYSERPEGSHSKLKTYTDGFKILLTILNLIKLEKPLYIFSLLCLFSLFFCFVNLSLGILLFSIFCVSGLILDNISVMRREQKILMYLRYE